MQNKIRSFKDLRVWEQAYELTLNIYQVTGKFPKSELYVMVSQMRRAAISVVSNIAEGYSRKSRMEYIQYLSVAYSSLSELETQIMLSRDLEYINEEDSSKLMQSKDQTGGMLYCLIQKLNYDKKETRK